MEENKTQSYDPADHHGSIRKMQMDKIEGCTRALMEAVTAGEAYTRYESVKKELAGQPELKKQINDFRRRNYLIQDQPDSEKLLLEMANLEREYEDFRKDPLVHEYLEAELRVCRMLQKINETLVSVIDLELDDFADEIML